jgi:hypothetical protein
MDYGALANLSFWENQSSHLCYSHVQMKLQDLEVVSDKLESYQGGVLMSDEESVVGMNED